MNSKAEMLEERRASCASACQEPPASTSKADYRPLNVIEISGEKEPPEEIEVDMFDEERSGNEITGSISSSIIPEATNFREKIRILDHALMSATYAKSYMLGEYKNKQDLMKEKGVLGKAIQKKIQIMSVWQQHFHEAINLIDIEVLKQTQLLEVVNTQKPININDNTNASLNQSCLGSVNKPKVYKEISDIEVAGNNVKVIIELNDMEVSNDYCNMSWPANEEIVVMQEEPANSMDVDGIELHHQVVEEEHTETQRNIELNCNEETYGNELYTFINPLKTATKDSKYQVEDNKNITPNATNEGDTDMYTLGPNGTKIPRSFLNGMKPLSSDTAITRKILSKVFGHELLAFGKLTDKPSRALKYGSSNKTVKVKLDEQKVADILYYCTSHLLMTKRKVFSTISSKCNDEWKLYNYRLSKVK